MTRQLDIVARERPTRNPRFLSALQRKLIERFGSEVNTRFFDPARFPWVAELESNWKTIRQDLDEALLDRERIPPFQNLNPTFTRMQDVPWSALVFYAYGRRIRENCERFPATAALLRRIPNITTAMFSILDGHAHIPAHFGPSKGVLRYHLGLIVPAEGDQCCIRVDNEIRSWREGKSLIFDDTFEHEVWNRDPRRRVVLFADILRPLPPVLSVINRVFMGMGKHHKDVKHIEKTAIRYARTEPYTQ